MITVLSVLVTKRYKKLYTALTLFYIVIWASSSEKVSVNMSSNVHKMRIFRSSGPLLSIHTCIICSDSVVSNDSVSGQRRLWSDCAQSDLGLHCPHITRRHSFARWVSFDRECWFIAELEGKKNLPQNLHMYEYYISTKPWIVQPTIVKTSG